MICDAVDCWDSKDGPIIYHGHTLTSKISFKAVVEAIRDHAFKISEYPVVLSLEIHCSVDGQIEMANIFKDIFGSKQRKRIKFEL